MEQRQERASAQTVMVVEDFDETRRMLRQFLESGGYGVVEASNGREAVEMARSATPALILMDLNMPVLDGFAAALRIRRQGPSRDVPIVAVTAYDSAESRAAARAVGCDDYLPKPFDYEQLLALVKRLTAKEARG
ncbi:MAG TPA: response regulator [Pyrinomonadaceae bacterium]|nr:response regulator [Pyrinomonadaceae bacterium]